MHLTEVAHAESMLMMASEVPEYALKSYGQRELRDQQLVLKAQAGDVEAFYALIEPYLRFMQNLVRPILPNAADAEDIAQDAVITAFTRIRQLRSLGSFRAWLLQIAVNKARMKRRSFVRTRTESLSQIASAHDNNREDIIFLDNRKMPFLEAENRQLREHLRKALNSIPNIYREVLFLRDIQELTAEQAAQILRLKPATLQTRLRRARALLKKKLLALWNSECLRDRASPAQV